MDNLEVKFYDAVNDELLKFAVIISQSNGKWVFCKHKERDTYEVPGGHREADENILETAKRELQEETGAVEFEIKPICVYSVTWKLDISVDTAEIDRKVFTDEKNFIIGTTVTVTVDRPLGSYHPKHKDMYYPLNYGYIEDIIDIVHRKDDIEEKWVVVPDGMIFSKDEIRQRVHF